jgi:hypothetical protein
MDATPFARSDAVSEMPADVALCVLWLDKMKVDAPLDKDAAWLIRSDTAVEMPADSDASASCSVETAVDRDADTAATSLILVLLDIFTALPILGLSWETYVNVLGASFGTSNTNVAVLITGDAAKKLVPEAPPNLMVVVPGIMAWVGTLTSNQPFAGRSLFLPCKIAVTPIAGMFVNANDISGFTKLP